jgi:hypothetical protein
MKTRALNLVSSPVVARLEKLENSGFLTLAPVAVAHYSASKRNSAFCILNSSIPPIPTLWESTSPQIHIKVGTRSTRACPATAAVPLIPLWLTPTEPLMRNHHASPQPTASWTAVALHRFPIYRNPLTLSKAHPQPTNPAPLLLLCVFASLREAFLSRFSPGIPSVLLRFWTLVLLIASTAGCTSKNIFFLNLQPTTAHIL